MEKGNIVLQANILNNTQYMAKKDKKINIQVKTLDGKTICSYTSECEVKVKIKKDNILQSIWHKDKKVVKVC